MVADVSSGEVSEQPQGGQLKVRVHRRGLYQLQDLGDVDLDQRNKMELLFELRINYPKKRSIMAKARIDRPSGLPSKHLGF